MALPVPLKMDWESLVWNTDLAWARKFVILAISRKADAAGIANISVIQIAALTGLARRTVHEQIALAIQHGHLQRIAPSLFHISLTHPDSMYGATRTSTAPPAHAQIQVDTPRLTDMRHPHTEKYETIPFPLNPLSIPPSSSSSVSSFLPVLENEELGQEGISITRAAQPELIPTEFPDWYLRLQRLPIIVNRPFTPADIADVQRDFPLLDLAIQASAFVAYWTTSKRILKVPLLAWRNWLRRTSKDDAAKQNRDHNGRYPRGRGLGPAVIPDDPSYYDPGSKLSAFRR